MATERVRVPKAAAQVIDEAEEICIALLVISQDGYEAILHACNRVHEAVDQGDWYRAGMLFHATLVDVQARDGQQTRLIAHLKDILNGIAGITPKVDPAVMRLVEVTNGPHRTRHEKSGLPSRNLSRPPAPRRALRVRREV
jgi:hypothetical protein